MYITASETDTSHNKMPRNTPAVVVFRGHRVRKAYFTPYMTRFYDIWSQMRVLVQGLGLPIIVGDRLEHQPPGTHALYYLSYYH